MNFISIIIATSLKRTDWLIQRSLNSVYNQIGIDKTKIQVLIVDDNEDEDEFQNIFKQIIALRKNLGLQPNQFETKILKNSRTRFMSGTGAWNTGIFEAYKVKSDGFTCILDDDDAYLPNHLTDCLSVIDSKTVAVFQRLFWKNIDGTKINFPLSLNDLTPEKFFIGNPGIQGSNMFFKTEQLIFINGFDENLPNTTDRDLMIRFLWHFNKLKEKKKLKIKIITRLGVVHYNHDRVKINNDFKRKHNGLDLFYQKYRQHFSKEAYLKSLDRAKQFFNYPPITTK